MSETVALGRPSHVSPGLVIAGKYRLEDEIGRGSMGTVYRAVHVTLGQRVAIKLISAEHSQSVEARQRFSVEAKAAAKLRSRHVVQVIDDGETPEGNPYIVLEYLDGETLEQRLERDHDLPLLDAVRIVTHVGRALARAHAQGIVHRDLKPANIFLVRSDDDDAGWVAKVLDFGIAKLEHGESGTTQAGTVLGTPLFMSPEQVRGASSVDHRADLYSLGMCLFHMLTGEFAYYCTNYSDILVNICTRPLPKLRGIAPWVPASVEHWFQRACAKEALERFQSADEMTEALQAAAGSTPLSKHGSTPEWRIAPETLVGYAPPALATLQLDTTPIGLARTQAAGSSSGVPAGPGLVPIAIHSDPRARTDPRRPAAERRDFRAVAIGFSLGLAALAALACVIAWMAPDGSEQLPGATSSRITGGGPASPPASPLPSRSPAPAALPAAEGVGSSEAAEPARVEATRRERAVEVTKKPPKPGPAGPPLTRKPARPPTSDLGF